MSYSKPIIKPLKGGRISSATGSFDVLDTKMIKSQNLNIPGVFEDGVLSNIILENSELLNTIIGINGPSDGYFNNLYIYNNVVFIGQDPDNQASFDPVTGIFTINGGLVVRDCSQLGNIRICVNDIRATNLNGDVNIISDNVGTVRAIGPFSHTTTFGNFSSRVATGSVSFDAYDNISFLSRNSTFETTSKFNQTFNILNGDYTINTELGRALKTFNIQNTESNLLLTFSTSHNLQVGDVVSVTSNSSIPQIISNLTVGSILNENSILIPNTTVLTSNGTAGSLLKYISNNINLNAGLHVKIPQNISLTFGDTCNNIYGNTSGLVISATNDLIFNVPCTSSTNSNKIQIPAFTNLQFGTSGNNFINSTTGGLNITSLSQLNINTPIYNNQASLVQFSDPIIKIANYNTIDNKDRGIEFNYGNNQLGWFGYKSTTNSFSFYSNATNTNEIISGTLGNFTVNQLSANLITLNSASTLNINCGTIANLSFLSACSENLSIRATSNIYFTSSNYYIQSLNIQIPNASLLRLGTIGNYFSENSNNNLVIHSPNNIIFSTNTNGSITIPVNTKLTFDNSTLGQTSISGLSNGSLLLNSPKDIMLNTTSGNISIPSNTPITFNNTSQQIYGNSTGIVISNSSFILNSHSGVSINNSIGNIILSSYTNDILLIPTQGNIRIPITTPLVFSLTSTSNSISTNTNNNLIINGASTSNIVIRNTNEINLSAGSSVNIPFNTSLVFGTHSNQILANTNNNLQIFSPTLSIQSTSALFNASNINMTSTNLYMLSDNVFINSPNVKIIDPIITLANYNTIDNKDRGMEFYYYTNGNQLLGWSGYKSSLGRFQLLTNATNNNEIITGQLANLELAALSLNSIDFITRGNLNINCGTISNVNTILGCNGILNLNATMINLSASDSVNIPTTIPLKFGNNSIVSDSSGNLFINTDTLVVNSNLQIMGTSSSVYSTITTIQDPIISLGGVTGPSLNDLKDRGIEFKWHDGISSKIGFFGYDNSLARFVFIQDGTNNNEIFSGSFGNAQFNTGYFNVIDLQNGTLANVHHISSTNLSIDSPLVSFNSSSVSLNYNTQLYFGSSVNSIYANTSNNLLISSLNNTIFNTTSGINIFNNVPLNLGSSSIYNSDGNLQLLNTSGNILLTPQFSTGNIIIPTYNNLVFGNDFNRIYSDGQWLYLYGYQGIGMNTSTVNISGNVNIAGVLTAGIISATTTTDPDLYIFTLGTFQNIDIVSIENISSAGNILVTVVDPHNLIVGDAVSLFETNSNPILDGDYLITQVTSPTSFQIIYLDGAIDSNGNSGYIKSNLTVDQNKDVGIQVNYWSTTGNPGVTVGTANFKTGFFGFKQDSERWSFYQNSTISNNVVTGSFGDVEINKLFTNNISGFGLDGTLSAGNNLIVGTNFDINGGEIDNTPIGQNIVNSGRFSNLSNTISANLSNLTLQSTLKYSFERINLSSSTPYISPNTDNVITLFSVTGVNFNNASGTLASTSIADGTIKKIVCSSMGIGCSYTVFLGIGKLIAPNPPTLLNPTPSQPSQIIFKRMGQSCELVYDILNSAWILTGGNGCYIY